MNPEEIESREHFLKAIDIEAGSEREAFLDKVCAGNPSMRRDLEAMLWAHEQRESTEEKRDDRSVGSGTDRHAVDATVIPVSTPNEPQSVYDPDALQRAGADSESEPGTLIRYLGDYEIQDVLGRGGMGIVYRARQISLNRPVALKMIKSGVLAGADELRRFRNEADAIALLDHVGIVPVYEVGEHNGQQYFSMKLIEGGSLVERLQDYKEDPRAAAKLVAATAEAVSHAHIRGILHRDLKPANLLIDGDGNPHVTDFGLARRIESDGELTQTGQILGTPAYMPPEQASGRRGSVTTATDVYGLGAVLYALLTGKAPFGGDSAIETLDAVRNHPPAPPTKLNAATPRDLETITLKCLEKDPLRRYSSAQGLVDDLQAWLENRPISARRVGAVERAWLWCKRRPAVAGLTAATVVAILAGTATTIAVQASANRELQAEYETTRQAEALADRRLDRAMAAIRDYYTGFAEEAIKGEQIPVALRERLLARPQEFYEELTEELAAKENPLSGEQRLLAEGQLGLGNIFLLLGRHGEAGRQGDAAIELFETLLAAEPDAPEYASGLAECYTMLGNVLSATGETEPARAAHEKAIDIGEALVAANPDVSDFKRDLARAYSSLGNIRRITGDTDGASEAHRKTISLYQSLVAEEPDVSRHKEGLASGYSNLGLVLSATPAVTEAQEAYAKAIKTIETLADENPDDDRYQDVLAGSLTNLGLLLDSTGSFEDAKPVHTRSLDIYKALVIAKPGVPEFQDGLAGGYVNLGRTLGLLGETQKAIDAQLDAIGLYKSLTASRPGVPEYQDALSTSYLNLGAAYRDINDDAKAREAYANAIEQKELLAAAHPEVLVYRYGLAATYSNLANVQKDAGDLDAAGEAYVKAIAMLDELLVLQPDVPDYRYALSIFHINLAILLKRQGDPAAALTEFRLSQDFAFEGTPVADELPGYIEEAEALIAASERLPGVLSGSDAPQGAAEYLIFAQLCYSKSLYASAARFWNEALTADPTLAEDPEQHRFNAAVAAALAASGNGKDDPAPDDAQKQQLRTQALAWLTAELATWSSLLETVSPEERPGIIRNLSEWQTENDLAGFREPYEQIPESEVAAWRSFWEQVRAKSP